MKSKWRAIALLALLALSVFGGIGWQLAATSGESQNPAGLPPSLSIGIYTTDPTEPINVRLEMSLDRQNETQVRFFLQQPPVKATVLLTANLEDSSNDGIPVRFKPITPATQATQYSYFFEISPAAGTKSRNAGADPRGAVYATWVVPSTYLVQDEDEIKARMPLVASLETGLQYVPAALSYAADNSGGTSLDLSPKEVVAQNDVGKRAPDPFFPAPEVSEKKELFWQPEHLSTTEALVGVAQSLQGWNLEDSPSNGAPEGDDFVWHGAYDVSATMNASNPSLVASKAHYEFFSGIAWATGAAALIALIQEGEDKGHFLKFWRWRIWHRSRWRREKASEEPEPASVSTNASAAPGAERATAEPPVGALTTPAAPAAVAIPTRPPSQLRQGMVIGFGMAAALAVVRRLSRR